MWGFTILYENLFSVSLAKYGSDVDRLYNNHNVKPMQECQKLHLRLTAHSNDIKA